MERDLNGDNTALYIIGSAQLLQVERCRILAKFFRSRFESWRLLSGPVWVDGWVGVR